MIRIVRAFLFLMLLLFLGCSPDKAERLVMFHAGSLSYPLREMVKEFGEEHPQISILSEAAGSVHTARKITELNRRADILASADYQIINSLLIPEHASFNLLFASNSMVLAYHEQAAFSHEVNATNWHEVLVREGVRNGASDPHADPCGYRTRLLLQLAEKYYDVHELSEKILSGQNHYQRPKETDLLALLETRTLDYIFIYESVAVQHGLAYVSLPDSINLSNPVLNDWYGTVAVDIRGNRANQTVRIQGEAITYGITLPFEATNSHAALLFLAWILTPEKGGEVLRRSGQQPVFPAVAYGYNDLPDRLKLLAVPVEKK